MCMKINKVHKTSLTKITLLVRKMYLNDLEMMNSNRYLDFPQIHAPKLFDSG